MTVSTFMSSGEAAQSCAYALQEKACLRVASAATCAREIQATRFERVHGRRVPPQSPIYLLLARFASGCPLSSSVTALEEHNRFNGSQYYWPYSSTENPQSPSPACVEQPHRQQGRGRGRSARRRPAT